MSSASDTVEKRDHPTVHKYDVDVGAQLIASDTVLTQQEAARLRCVVSSSVPPKHPIYSPHRAKIDWHIMPFMCSKSEFSNYIRSLLKTYDSHVSVSTPATDFYVSFGSLSPVESPSWTKPLLEKQQCWAYCACYPRVTNCACTDLPLHQRGCRSICESIQLARDDILFELPRFSISPEFGIAALSCWKMDEVR
jgi:hypothetical protein